jgi:hypothetical protein
MPDELVTIPASGIVQRRKRPKFGHYVLRAVLRGKSNNITLLPAAGLCLAPNKHLWRLDNYFPKGLEPVAPNLDTEAYHDYLSEIISETA